MHSKNYRQSFENPNVISLEGKLWIGNTLQASDWEKTIQTKAAKLLSDLKCVNVLDIGFGLGMFSAAYMRITQAER